MSFMEIFQPGLKYLREERERQRMNVAYPTDGADPLMEIDLDAGTATIVITTPDGSPGTDSPPQALAEADADDPAGAADLAIVGQPETATNERAEADGPAGQPSAD
jgi:hypothetical protein